MTGKLEARVHLRRRCREEAGPVRVRAVRTLQRRVFGSGGRYRGRTKEVYFRRSTCLARWRRWTSRTRRSWGHHRRGAVRRTCSSSLCWRTAAGGRRSWPSARRSRRWSRGCRVPCGRWAGCREMRAAGQPLGGDARAGEDGGRGLTRRFAEVWSTTASSSSRIRPGESHENGVVEQAISTPLKSALDAGAPVARHPRLPERRGVHGFVGRSSRRRSSPSAREARLVEERAALQAAALRPRCPVHARGTSTCAVEHHPGGGPDLFGPAAPDRARGRGAGLRRCRRGPYANKRSRRCRGCAARGTPHRLPARDLVPGAQVRRVRAYRYRGGSVSCWCSGGLRRAPRASRGPRRTWSTCGCCTWQRARASTRWSRRHGAARARRGVRLRGGQGARVARQSRRCRALHRRPTSDTTTRCWPREVTRERAAYAPAMGERITAPLSEWTLPRWPASSCSRLVAGGHGEALPVLAEVLELEASGRKERLVERLAAGVEAAARQDVRHAGQGRGTADGAAQGAGVVAGRLRRAGQQCAAFRAARRRQ